MEIAAAFVSALIFGLGLCVSGLSNPAKVLGFLDVAGGWDPSLLLTMATSVLVTGIGYRLSFARGAPLLTSAFDIPRSTTIDRRLLAGSAIFGIGWGLVGFCPGPSLVALALGSRSALVFLAAMIAGMALARQLIAHAPSSAQLSKAQFSGTREHS